ncbi:hypothetical protein K6119_01565 [Paracrocinitomix mangrovi]|uniref:hypothetical protein n=1 Tax=Paracrocinitomix mangrovi TaxID=2862509 RepID=UPI001C8DC539|nr:hypothetical protein [Paracrocinitomix mangrovi]UKN02204.1 hypothetical protein K6119_01565 [Paracrocinitomix mangrovi]
MQLLLIFAFMFQGILPLQTEKLDTDHYVINATDQTIIVSVDYKDKANNPGQGSAMYTIPSGTALVISNVEGLDKFMHPTDYFTYSILTSGIQTDLNTPDMWILEKISDTKARYQCTIDG